MKKILITLSLLLLLAACALSVTCYASEEYESVPDASIDTAEPSQEQTFSDLVVESFQKYIGEIFCALTFLGSLLTTFLYKKGLLPALGEGINKIYSVVVKTGEKASEAQKEYSELLDAFIEKALPILERAKELSGYAEQLKEESLALKDELEREKQQRQILSKILTGQIDMLYGVFVSASLPEYQKEQLGAQYNRLRALITEGEVQKNESKD
jgi:hypothetical protein